MKLRTKLVVALVGLFIAYAIGSYAMQRDLVLGEFTRIEETEAASDLVRCREAFSNELGHLIVKVRDWAVWDDTYAFIVDKSQAYVDSNLKEDAFKVSDFHLIALVDRDRRVIWGGCRDTDYTTPLQLASFPPDRYPVDHELLRTSADDGEPVARNAVMLTEKGPLLASVSPILTSEGKGPSRGWLIMGRLVSDAALSRLRDQTRVDFAIHRLDGGEPPARIAKAKARMTAATAVFQEAANDDLRVVYGYVPESGQRLMIEARVPRAISKQGAATVRLTMLSFAAAAGLVCVLVVVLLQLTIIGPLGRLARRATEIGRTGDLTRGSELDRKDEIGDLAREFDGMVGSLKDLRAKLVESSRHAGMADVATGVLHNVGNVLNSLNVSTATLAEDVRKSKAGGLARALDLMDKHRDDLVDFITKDEKGRNLMTYLRELANAMAAERDELGREIGELRASVDHVNEVIRSQEAFARCGSFVEPASLKETIERALAIMTPGFERHGIVVRTSLAEIPTTLLDGSKCTQVLVNLLSNAKDALASGPSGKRVLEVRLGLSGDGEAVIEVADNGVGIQPEHLARIFASGFTTKAAGRGVGLHYSALAAKEMGGDLSAESAGAGLGATFTLRLPVRSLVQEPVG